MAIHHSGLFDLSADMTRTGEGWWGIGRAARPEFPGLVGDRPTVHVLDETVRLTGTRDGADATFRFAVGPAVNAVLQNGDQLRVCREGTGDVSALATRGSALVLALGAVDTLEPFGIAVALDPRVADRPLVWAKRELQRADTVVIWVDTCQPGYEAAAKPGASLASRSLLFVVRGDDHKRVSTVASQAEFSRSGSRSYYYVPESVASLASWVARVEAVPDERPSDLFVRFTVDDRSIEIPEYGYAITSNWFLGVPKVYRDGIPGELTRLAVARADLPLTETVFLQSAAAFCPEGRLSGPMIT